MEYGWSLYIDTSSPMCTCSVMVMVGTPPRKAILNKNRWKEHNMSCKGDLIQIITLSTVGTKMDTNRKFHTKASKKSKCATFTTKKAVSSLLKQ